MSAERASVRRYTWRPLTPARWGDLEAFFGPNGASSGCWCMSFRLERSTFRDHCRAGGAANRAALHEITLRGDAPGILAYAGNTPVGWCSVAPRAQFPRLDRSPHSRRRGETPAGTSVWSAVCFYVGRAQRRRGVMAYLVHAAIEYVRERGGGVIEAYPRRDAKRFEAGSGWAGLLPVFVATGFVEVARSSPTRSIVRYVVHPNPEASSIHPRSIVL